LIYAAAMIWGSFFVVDYAARRGMVWVTKTEEIMIIHSTVKLESAPEGKRTIRENRWGNTQAYIGGRFWRTIGPTYTVGMAESADAFLAGLED
jgi:hypothetical protein